MKILLGQLALMILVTNSTFAADFQGKVTKIVDNQLTIEIFGDETSSFKTGTHVILEAIPKNVPTLDMLKG
jgi:hypothetical protein